MQVSRGVKGGMARLIYRLPLRLRRHVMYLGFTRRIGHFRRPRTFNEKVNWRILHDRRPLLLWTCDKLSMKAEAEKLGIPVAKTLWSGTDLAELAELELPDAWVLKPNHRSRKVHFGSGRVTDPAALKAKTHDWLDDEQGAGRGEWAYRSARHVFLVEERLGDGSPLVDYKFFTYGGEVHFVLVAHDTNKLRSVDASRRYYTGDWEPLQVRQRVELGPTLPRPERYDEMLDIARRMGRPFDFIRVDLYDVDGTILLGEVTPYPTGGLSPFDPRDFDRLLGEPWVLPRLDRSGGEA